MKILSTADGHLRQQDPATIFQSQLTNVISGTVNVIKTSTNTVVKTVNVSRGTFGIAISPNGSRAYVANNDSNALGVINTSTKRGGEDVAVGSEPFGIASI
jgi:YVTN family beta-propeller protein